MRRQMMTTMYNKHPWRHKLLAAYASLFLKVMRLTVVRNKVMYITTYGV